MDDNVRESVEHEMSYTQVSPRCPRRGIRKEVELARVAAGPNAVHTLPNPPKLSKEMDKQRRTMNDYGMMHED